MKVKGIGILGHGETPGLGDEIEQDYFKKRFEGKSLEQLEVVKVEGHRQDSGNLRRNNLKPRSYKRRERVC